MRRRGSPQRDSGGSRGEGSRKSRQRLFPLFERARRLHRAFKRAIVALTALVAVIVVAAAPQGRSVARSLGVRARGAWKQLWTGESSPADWQDAWRERRLRSIEATRTRYRDFYEREASADFQRLFEAAGMAPEDATIRWAMDDWTIVFSSKVFEADDEGRSYRLKPNTRAFWTRNVFLPHGLNAPFLVPDTPAVRDAARRAGLELDAAPRQSTNSWGCRGPEPDLTAPLRVLVLGDSFMQGYLVNDDETAPEYLRRDLTQALEMNVAVLNTGHLAYSPEQYYFTLRALVDRFDPHFVVVALYTNDFGDRRAVLSGDGNWWDSARYWIQRIQQLCRAHEVGCLLAAVPDDDQLVSRRKAGHFPGRAADDSTEFGPNYLDPTDMFVDETLRLRAKVARAGKPSPRAPLYLERFNDDHFSPAGAALWARAVARRVALLLSDPRYSRKRSPELRERAASGPHALRMEHPRLNRS